MESAPKTRPHDSAQLLAYELPRKALLPAICPVCAAPGTRVSKVPRIGQITAEESELEAYYCDLCADERGKKTTERLALFSALALLTISVATASALFFGTRAIALQATLTLTIAALLKGALIKLQIWPRSERDLFWEESETGAVLWCKNKKYQRILEEHDFLEVDKEQPRPSNENLRQSARLLILGAAWLLLIHSLGGADVRVLVVGNEGAFLLVDNRHFGAVHPSNQEDPRAGTTVRVLGGRRHLELVSASGATLGGATQTIWPGRTYIVAHLKPGVCLYFERRTYGYEGRSRLVPLGGGGPVWELREPVDSWLIPLENPGAEDHDDEDWGSSGGERRAVRLLPCRRVP